MKFQLLLPLAVVAALAFTGCSEDNDAQNQAKLEVRLTDAPGDFSRVSLDVQQIEVHLKDEADPAGWEKLNFTPQTLNILDYVNGRSALLVSTDFAPGDLKEIRLILGSNNTVTARDGEVYTLKTPSGQTSGVKLKLDKATLRAGETYQLLLDFDVAKSIVERGNWKPGNDKKERYLLKPVVRLVAQEITGGIYGQVTPAAALPQVLAIRSSLTPADTFSTNADATGAYRLQGLPSGTYRLEYFPTTTAPTNQPAYHSAVRTGVVVVNNQLTNVPTVGLAD
ncbi:DUF4382 domain-containing protein [Hymenobacter chitinivorans]|uniref:Uncharacterized protein DUF4382 n=1 Tax=Hymenobacter chitinivorans DSM 11115 TaxID=1121954 RepID=A0A2M9B4F9_9BACT|nr:DUF4382 domain-containing protein [Hymenobacter chitinivorans]PJJ52813.1 uncharacterized protein DUF4382 [Hymenobacter chitinivorans DSM 11115]